MAYHRLAQTGLHRAGQMQGALRQAIWSCAEVAHAVDQIGVSIWCLIGHVGKALLKLIAVKNPAL